MGIRAHDFEPLSQTRAEELGDQEGENLIPVGTPTISEMPFEWYITLENGLWWKCEKSIHASNDPNQIPKWLRVPSGALMLLTGEQSEEEMCIRDRSVPSPTADLERGIDVWNLPILTKRETPVW